MCSQNIQNAFGLFGGFCQNYKSNLKSSFENLALPDSVPILGTLHFIVVNRGDLKTPTKNGADKVVIIMNLPISWTTE